MNVKIDLQTIKILVLCVFNIELTLSNYNPTQKKMYGAGHVMDMINRMKQNRAMRPSQRAKFKEHNREAIYATEEKRQPPTYKTVSESELKAIKAQIRTRAKTTQKKDRLFYGIFFTFWLILLTAFLIWIN
jgi:hypothetical protein